MTRIVLVRHGQTEWNRHDRFRGHIDVGLNATGTRQAAEAGATIARRYHVSAIYSSPLSRAASTAAEIGRATEIPITTLAAITDFSYGEWEGKTPEEVAVAYPDAFRLWNERPHLAQLPGGESLEQLRDRACTAIEELAASRAGQTIVVVTHRMVAKVLACHFLGLPNSRVWNLEMATASISLFEKRDAGWVTLLLNDTGHLEWSPGA